MGAVRSSFPGKLTSRVFGSSALKCSPAADPSREPNDPNVTHQPVTNMQAGALPNHNPMGLSDSDIDRIVDAVVARMRERPGRPAKGGMTPTAFGRRIGLSRQTILRRIESGVLRANPDGAGGWLIPKEEAERVARFGFKTQ